MRTPGGKTKPEAKKRNYLGEVFELECVGM